GNIGSTSSSLNVAVDTTNPVVASVALTSSLASNLRVPITTDTTPTIRANVTEQTFAGFTNLTRVELVNKADNSVLLPFSDVTIAANNVAQQVQLTPATALTPGQYTIFVRVTDAAGNSAVSSDFIFFVSEPGADTTDAPGTPVFTETFFIGSKVAQAAAMGSTTVVVDREIPAGFSVSINNTSYFVTSISPHALGTQLTLNTGLTAAVTVGETAAWLRPWTQTFDRTTQTIWFTNEDGSRLGQFDPATSQIKLFDVSLSASNGGFPDPTAVDPHGVFFDFDTHITPRVWFVYRNTESVVDNTGMPVSGGQMGRVAYLDLGTGQLVTMSLENLLDASDTAIDPMLIEQPHAALVDARGHLWITVEHSKTLIEFDFDQLLDGTLNPTINTVGGDNSRSGRAIVHDIPDSFASTAEPHGLGTVVDDRTGEQYIYFTDGNNSSLGRVYLLKPGSTVAGNVDQWFEWDFDAALSNEGRLASPSGHALFLAIDDHETPGSPEDDTILVSDPGRGLTNTAGVIRELNPQALIEALRNGTALPTTSLVRTVRIPKIPGASAGQTFSSPQLPFNDREGNVFFVDALGSVGRFNFDDALLDPLRNDADGNAANDSQDEASIDAPINAATTVATLFAAKLDAVTVPMTTLTATTTVQIASGSDDRSQGDGFDQYEVAQTSSKNRSDGPFRGFLNAANVVYGSLAQSDTVSTTVFAETARRQMSVVADPTALPTGAIVEGRMAFQVARNGSLIMTSREHGMLLDQQTNLSRTRILAGDTAEQILIDGDSSSVTEANGNVHVFGKNQVGGLVEYRFNRATSAWSTNVLPAPAAGVLAGEPTAFIDEQGRVGALINRHDGHLLLYRNGGSAPTDLTDLAGGGAPTIFASVDVVEDTASDTILVYGSDQAGSVVQYSFSTTTAIPVAATAGTITVTTGQTGRATQIFQSLSAVLVGGTRHIFGTDGHSRLVHLEITNPATLTAFGENVTELSKVAATGYFDSFQQEFAARVYPELSVLVDPDNGTLFVYGTNGLDLVEFTRTGASWTAANLTNDIMKGVGDRIPANKVFGAPGTYVTPAGDRHVFQINADGDVVEYAFRKASDHFNTQNINLARGNSYTSLQDINVNVAPTLSIPAIPLAVIAGGPAVLVASDASVSDPDSPSFATGQLIVRTINGAAGDVLGIRSQTFADGDVIASAAGAVSFNSVAFGSFTGGTGSTPLVISFDSATSLDALEALLQSVQFSTPIASSIGVRLVDFELTDDTGLPSNRVAQQVTVDDTNPATSPLINPLL
ncbi:MAG: hypothetical protein IAG10_25880, partial [Planctomycetaceae bacterium]|nr:hypothetical protein [Planctomycetaceae bacterium]